MTSHFHPIVRQWFADTLGDPTSAQLSGWASIGQGRHTLIAAPTGSGKTLAAFLTAIDQLFREGLERPLLDQVRVVYVSPLKALSTDIHKNLAEPRDGIRKAALAAGLVPPVITAAVRTGDTTPSERAAMLRKPPHILVTTPESLYLLLTAERSRAAMSTVRTVIVDEIHAVIGSRRGAHLALSLERLQRAVERPLQRIGLSATQKPIEAVARWLAGGSATPCTIVDEGHTRPMDLSVELPGAPLDTVMSHEVWGEYYDRLAHLIGTHRTTLVFVNTRRMAERLARHLSERLGEDAVTAHHGSLAKEKRLDAESRLKNGQLRALVATASLELGIDIGHVDLVCQIGSPHRISTLLQRVGRSGHTIAGTPKGRLFPVSRDDLLECAALLRCVRRRELDAIVQQDAPLDVLTQQIVAEAASSQSAIAEDELYDLARRTRPYRDLTRAEFDAVIAMAADGFSTRRGRRAALLHRDEVNLTVRSRRGTRLLAQTSGGAIPDVADYRVVQDPDETLVGTLNEDFAIESSAGDVFQLGNTSWQILQVTSSTVRVVDAKGAPPTIPFWLGEAPARSDELSAAVSDLREIVDSKVSVDGYGDPSGVAPRCAIPVATSATSSDDSDSSPIRVDTVASSAVAWMAKETGLPFPAAEQLLAYLAEGRRALGVIPSQRTLVLERFFDESGGMQLVLHAPFGSRINKAWCLALRKRFCRQFNFELQAAATDDALLLSLGPQHSFPLADVFRYLHPQTARDVLVQALLDAPVFKTRWRWNATIALAVPRTRSGRRLAAPLQRMLADDLLSGAFPEAAACLENIPGDRQIPDHPLVRQTVQDCLQEAMDFEGLRAVLGRIHRREIRLESRDTPEPSVFAYDILNAKPYAFLDDAPLEERRARAVQTRGGGGFSGTDLGALDGAAIDRVREEARPDPRDADELHDALMIAGVLTPAELETFDPSWLQALVAGGRATRVQPSALCHGARSSSDRGLFVTAERLPELRALHSRLTIDPPVRVPVSRTARVWTAEAAVIELLRGRLTITGPVTAEALADTLGITTADVLAGLTALESEGVVLRGSFTPGGGGRATMREWCDRALLARIHRYTLTRLRAEIEPVTPADFMRFLFTWQRVLPGTQLAGLEGLREAVALLDGFELPAAAWERAVLPARIQGYEPSMLDMLCLTGEVGWARLSEPRVLRLVSVTPIALFLREHGEAWQACRVADVESIHSLLGDDARFVLARLRDRGPSFFDQLADTLPFDIDRLRHALAQLVAAGLAASDGFSGLRLLVAGGQHRRTVLDRRRNFAGRWSSIGSGEGTEPGETAIELYARTLLRRYGVVFRRLLIREPRAVAWRDIVRVYRRMEARGEIRGGRFVSGMAGEQYAAADAVTVLREVRRTPLDGQLRSICTADPLNLTGIVTSGERVRAAGGNRLVYRDGIPVGVIEGENVRGLVPLDASAMADVARALSRRRLTTKWSRHAVGGR